MLDSEPPYYLVWTEKKVKPKKTKLKKKFEKIKIRVTLTINKNWTAGFCARAGWDHKSLLSNIERALDKKKIKAEIQEGFPEKFSLKGFTICYCYPKIFEFPPNNEEPVTILVTKKVEGHWSWRRFHSNKDLMRVVEDVVLPKIFEFLPRE